MGEKMIGSSNATTLYRVVRVKVDVSERRHGALEINMASLKLLQSGDFTSKAVIQLGDKKWFTGDAPFPGSHSELMVETKRESGEQRFRVFLRRRGLASEIDEGAMISLRRLEKPGSFELLGRGTLIRGEWEIICEGPSTSPTLPLSGGVMCLGGVAAFAAGISFRSLQLLAKWGV